jgi:aminopeptidase-like protein
MNDKDIANEMYMWAVDLFPICRSITGDGVRQTLHYLSNKVDGLTIKDVPSGYKAFDWVVPEEWNINDAYIENEKGEILVDFKKNNLHIMGYSCPIDEWVSFSELQNHLHSIESLPEAIPYVTSYYKKDWAFCISDFDRRKMTDQQYHVVIDSGFKKGTLNYGEIILKGESTKEVFLSTYVCHPSMANNELSGPVVTLALVKWLTKIRNLRYTYRIIFIPETIGSIVYLSKNIKQMQERVIAGYNVTCVGDNNSYSFVPSRKENTLSDKVAKYVLNKYIGNYKEYTFLDRGSDERQYCHPKVDLPIASLMRTKYGEYKEYHTSLDNLDYISADGLYGGYSALKKCIEIIEFNRVYQSKVTCEPHLSSRGLYPYLGTIETRSKVRDLMNFLAYIDGKLTLLDIAEKINYDIYECQNLVETLLRFDLIEVINEDY